MIIQCALWTVLLGGPVLRDGAGDGTDQAEAPVLVRNEVDAFLSERDWPRLKSTVSRWQRQSLGFRVAVIKLLQSRLGDRTEVRLQNYGDMVVPSRVAAGKQVFPGHGEIADQDVFTVNGLSAWSVEQLLERPLPRFTAEDDAQTVGLKASKAAGVIAERLRTLK